MPDEKHDSGTNYIVIALTASIGTKYEDCQVIEADAMYAAIYSKVFGPASKEECEHWRDENCGKVKPAESTAQKVYEVDKAFISVYLSLPAKVGIVATGKTRTTGWTNGHLSEWVYIMPPPDGIYDFDFNAAPPQGASGDMIDNITSKRYMMQMPENFRGVRIHAETNEKEFLLGSEGMELVEHERGNGFLSELTDDLSSTVKFSLYAGGLFGGPKKASQALIYSANEYQRWLGDIDPGFAPHHSYLEHIDFNREMLVVVGLGEMDFGQSVSIDSIELITGGIMGGHAFIRYTIHSPHMVRPRIMTTPFVVVRCPIFYGYTEHFLRSDDEMPYRP